MYADADADKDKNISLMLISQDEAIQLWAEICALKLTYKDYKKLTHLEQLRNHLSEGINLTR